METEKHTPPGGTIQTRVIGVSGMTCDHCVARVEKALRGGKGVKDVRVERALGRATVIFDSAVTGLADFQGIVMRAGYRVSAVD